MASPDENELAVAVGFYRLFLPIRSDRIKNSSQKFDLIRNTRNSTTKTNNSDQDDICETGGVWENFSWDESDEAEARHVLEKYEERCLIPKGAQSLRKKGKEESKVDDAVAWDRFYGNHGNKFFKDRYHLVRSFPIEFSEELSAKKSKTLVEVGCGVGNAILPLLGNEKEEKEEDHTEPLWECVHGIDLSEVAIELLRKEPRFIKCNKQNNQSPSPKRTPRAFAHVCDISKTVPPECVCVSDVTSLLFCLSAMDPVTDMPRAAALVVSTLKPGGILVLRDYGRFDDAQLKLGTSRHKRLPQEHFYRKSDNTRCYYFTLEDLERLFCVENGLEVLELEYLRRKYKNNATGQIRRRIWVQGRFRKPVSNQ